MIFLILCFDCFSCLPLQSHTKELMMESAPSTALSLAIMYVTGYIQI